MHKVSLLYGNIAFVQPPFLPRATYALLFLLLAVVYMLGLFVPLMDNDAAHHASIALHLYRTGDYVNLIENGKDYLDKPHLHFWLAALSYTLFGVTSFAYKLPSFLFTLLGTYATFRLGRRLYNTEVGRLAALIVASAFAYVLSNNDVRMDAILTASIIFATWQLVDWVNEKRWISVVGAALGLALGFCTKGDIGVFTPALSVLFYVLYKREWKALWHVQLFAIIALFFVFISPVLYCYYLQFDLHPEKVIRGKSGRSGVAFILWQQNFERFQGDDFGASAGNDRLFFIHSFLWAFAPWSVLTFVAFFSRLKSFVTRRNEWLTGGTFAVVGLLISFSGFKLPHYLNIIFPVSAVLTAGYLYQVFQKPILVNRLFVLQVVLSGLMLLAAAVINVWFFPVKKAGVLIGFVFLLGSVVFLMYKARTKMQQLITLSAAATVLVFYLLNTNFYPQLLTYQGGNQLAFYIRHKLDPTHVYFWPDVYSSSFNFYSGGIEIFSDRVLQQPAPVWVLADSASVSQVETRYGVLKKISARDYEITRLRLSFLNPATREKQLTALVLLQLK